MDWAGAAATPLLDPPSPHTRPFLPSNLRHGKIAGSSQLNVCEPTLRIVFSVVGVSLRTIGTLPMVVLPICFTPTVSAPNTF